MKKYLAAGLIVLAIPGVLILGATVFQDKQYAWISLAVAVLACVPFLLSFERKQTGNSKLILIAVMTALSVAGRLLFAALPGFKPVTAMVVLTAMYFGGEAGFLTGALTALLSNFYFGQGPWTPFQMFTWGLLGFFAGLLRNRLKSSAIFLAVLRRLCRGGLFSDHGRMVGALGGRHIPVGPLRCGGGYLTGIYGDLCGVQCNFSAAFAKADGTNSGQSPGEIRD